ncbi:MAG: glycosyltransferase family 4 protein [Alphaproteobacteria bacterium]|nr:glycosyltransferase family 4 protein [Alphaproteobacteria bacterium]
MRRVMGIAKSVYYFFFRQIAYLRLRGRGHAGTPQSGAVNIVCRFGVQNGLANGALYQCLAFEKLGYAARKVDITPAIKNPFRKISCSADGPLVFHCAAPQFLQFAWPLRDAVRGRRLIGYFAWELDEPPADWPDYPDMWDEIWTTSVFSARSLARKYRCPVHVVPHVLIGREGAPRVWRKGDEPLVFLTMADARSSLMRKNPAGAIDAFREAFPDERDVAMVVKLQMRGMTPEVERILAAAAGDARIRVITENMSRAEVDDLMARAHVYVSLHRAEGFGLPLLEARVAGLATIATAWSGNMDFMGENDSALIPFKLAHMVDEGGVYGAVTWADPDIGAAARAMRRFYDDPDYLASIARAGWEASRPDRQVAVFSAAAEAALNGSANF